MNWRSYEHSQEHSPTVSKRLLASRRDPLMQESSSDDDLLVPSQPSSVGSDALMRIEEAMSAGSRSESNSATRRSRASFDKARDILTDGSPRDLNLVDMVMDRDRDDDGTRAAAGVMEPMEIKAGSDSGATPRNFNDVDDLFDDNEWNKNEGTYFTRDSQPPVTLSRRDSKPVMHRRESDGNFLTIDWTTGNAEARTYDSERKERFRERGYICAALYHCMYAMQGWVLLTLIGFFAAFCASAIHTGAEWLIELKEGYCQSDEHPFWLSKHLCCLDAKTLDRKTCTDWHHWNTIFGPDVDHVTGYWIDYMSYIGIGTFCACLCAWLVKTFAPQAAGSGIPEVKVVLGGFIVHRVFGMWTLLIKSVGLILAVGSGLNLGKEGPLVHVACCCGNVLSGMFVKFSQNEVKKREILSASAAAGVSVAFGAPLGGVLFSLEEVSTYFPHKTLWRSFFCAIMGSAMLKWIDPFHTGKLVQFQVSYNKTWHWFEIPAFALLGCFGGLVGTLFIELNLKICQFRRRTALKNWPVVEVAVVAIITGVINYQNIYLRGSATELLARLFGDCRHPDEHFFSDQFTALCNLEDAPSEVVFLLVAGAAKMILTLFTFGIKIPSGLFIPSLCIGACFGRVLGTAIQLLYKTGFSSSFIFAECGTGSYCITPGIYAIVGAAAVLGGVTRMTVSLVVIMFELTGGLEYILPVMIAAITSKWMADFFGREGIYDRYVELNGYPYFDPKLEIMFPAQACEVMTSSELSILFSSHSFEELQEILATSTCQGYPVVTSREEMNVVGYISRLSLEVALMNYSRKVGTDGKTRVFFVHDPMLVEGGNCVDFSPWLDRFPIQVVDTTPLDRLYEMFKGLGLRYCLVQRHGRLVGIIKKKDILAYLEDVKTNERSRRRSNLYLDEDDGV